MFFERYTIGYKTNYWWDSCSAIFKKWILLAFAKLSATFIQKMQYLRSKMQPKGQNRQFEAALWRKKNKSHKFESSTLIHWTYFFFYLASEKRKRLFTVCFSFWSSDISNKFNPYSPRICSAEPAFVFDGWRYLRTEPWIWM